MSEIEKQEPSKQQESNYHPFDRLMFGTRRVPVKVEEDKAEPQSTSTSKQSESFDMMTMIQNVDQLMGSVNKFKPMVKQLAPLLDLFKTKK
ncbi:hypothetical protein ACOI1C_07940 [Bacillus sp. DJP31]|uniref:hypothetical protein n=1 Tax=Bacillus sp. DJP31 TaxID=3409789 RepID=UPI003BB6CCBC